MEAQSFTTLAFAELRTLLRRYAQTPSGAYQIETMAPISEHKTLLRSLAAVTESVSLRARGLGLSFSGLEDLSQPLALARIDGAIIEPLWLLTLARHAERALAARGIIMSEAKSCPVLVTIVEPLPRELSQVAQQISAKILPNGDIDDRASPQLAQVRHDITRLRASIAKSLERLMERNENAIQDNIITVRNDRFVIPVKHEQRGHLSGVAHGFSSSGATVFIEPLETIESNNELQILRDRELQEIARILLTLSNLVRTHIGAFELCAAVVAELDCINARAIFLNDFACTVPEISLDNTFRLVAARHPLLQETLAQHGKEVVPVTLTLDQTHPLMIISGANAGGKTVVLKTAGLLTLMALSGIPVPASQALIPHYQSVLADIGDHQSLSANLSTFTSHVANISTMIQGCKSPALVLLDEVGTGTDPDEGSALGVAVVDYFRRKFSAHIIATTHYRGLKTYAAREAAVQNASVEFDDKTLRPTYKLLLGLAGSSSGIEIARRFGFPQEVADAARALVDTATQDAIDYLQRLKLETQDAIALRLALEEERRAVAHRYEQLESEAQKRELERERAFESQVNSVLVEFDTRVASVVEAIENRAQRLKIEAEMRERRAELKRHVTETARSTRVDPAPDLRRASPRVIRQGDVLVRKSIEPARESEHRAVTLQRPLRIGDLVRMRTFGSVGTIQELSGNGVEVRVNNMRMRAKLEDLELVESTAPVVKGNQGSRATARSNDDGLQQRFEAIEAQVELNLIGKTTDVGVDEADKFLDQAFLAGLSSVRIVHGRGTGALRKAIHLHLKGHAHVREFQPAAQDKGGDGATVVQLKS